MLKLHLSVEDIPVSLPLPAEQHRLDLNAFQIYVMRVTRARTGLLFLLFYFVLQNPDKIYEIGSPDGDWTRALRCDRPVF